MAKYILILFIVVYFGIQSPSLAQTNAASAHARLATVGLRLAQANRGACANTGRLTGVQLHDLSAYDVEIRPKISTLYGLKSGFGILSIAAEEVRAAGFQVGDEWLTISGESLEGFGSELIGKNASYDRMSAFEQFIADQRSTAPLSVKVQRGKEVLTLDLPYIEGCTIRFSVDPTSGVNAWTDGQNVAVSSALINIADDDELAFVLAHEMAHVVEGHKPAGILASMGVKAARVRQEEFAADQLALKYMGAAGFRSGAAVTMLVKLSRSRLINFGNTHPNFDSRVKAIREILMQ